MTSDWGRVKAIARLGRDASNERIAETLSLVRGRPFQNTAHRYLWAFATKHEITDVLLDLAHELASRAIAAGDADSAMWASGKGLLVEPLHERLWQTRLIAASHGPGLHEQVVQDLHEAVENSEIPYSLQTETLDLMATRPH